MAFAQFRTWLARRIKIFDTKLTADQCATNSPLCRFPPPILCLSTQALYEEPCHNSHFEGWGMPRCTGMAGQSI